MCRGSTQVDMSYTHAITHEITHEMKNTDLHDCAEFSWLVLTCM